jgi:hypothetical protein
MALSMEAEQIHWFIGRKSYEPEKIRVFLEAVWNRLVQLMKQSSICTERAELEEVCDCCGAISEDIKGLAQGIASGDETTPLAEQLFSRLKKGTAAFLTIYFRSRLSHFAG